MQVSEGSESHNCITTPVNFVYSNGSGRSGAFICLYYQLERLKTEGVVDLFQCVKSIRTQRPGLVDSVVSVCVCMASAYCKAFPSLLTGAVHLLSQGADRLSGHV